MTLADTGDAGRGNELALGEFLADVVKEIDCDENSRFIALRTVRSTRIYQRSLVCSEADLSKLILSLVFEDDEERFYCPTADGRGVSDVVWRNGLDDQRSLREAYMLFDDEPAAIEFLRARNPVAREAVFYSLARKDGRVLLEETGRLEHG
jgi:hypothetical protein